MLIEETAAVFKSVACVTLLAISLVSETGWAGGHFRLEKDAQGLFRPFTAVSVPLSGFLQEYSRLSGTPIAADGVWKDEIKGSVTLFIRKPTKPEQMAELVHRVLSDNGYAAVDAPAGNGWVIERSRDARYAALPIYGASEIPLTNRMVTAHQTLKYANADAVARMIRSFMPSTSMAIPAAGSQLLITDAGANIRKLLPLIARMDTPEAARRQREALSRPAPAAQQACGEQRIEKLVVEKLEIQDSGAKK